MTTKACMDTLELIQKRKNLREIGKLARQENVQAAFIATRDTMERTDELCTGFVSPRIDATGTLFFIP
jgi:hypothetical protein